MKLKTFCIAKKIINKIKRQPTEWENIFSDASGKALIYKIYNHQTKMFLQSKGNHQQNKKTTHRMGKHIHQHI